MRKQLLILAILISAAFILLGVLGWLVCLGKAPAATLVEDIQTGLGAIVGIIGAFHIVAFFRLSQSTTGETPK